MQRCILFLAAAALLTACNPNAGQGGSGSPDTSTGKGQADSGASANAYEPGQRGQRPGSGRSDLGGGVTSGPTNRPPGGGTNASKGTGF